MAKFRLVVDHFFPGDLYVDKMTNGKSTEIDIGPGTPYPDMKPSMGMEPLDDAARKMMADWERERGGSTDPLGAKAFPIKGPPKGPSMGAGRP